MPAQTLWMLRISLIYFLLAAFTGSLLLVHKAVPLHPSAWALLPLHYEMAIWGWVVQFVMGTAYWMFPRFLKGEIRGPEKPAWWMVILFNTGLIALLTSHALQPTLYFAAGGRVLLTLSILLFGFLMWNRVASFKHHDH